MNKLMLAHMARFEDLSLLLLRWVTGAFLVYQSQDNVFSLARMQVFVDFCRANGFVYPEILAPLSVYWQFISGLCFIFGLFVRLNGWITAFNFAVAVAMVHWAQDFPGWWPALILVFLGQYFGTRGGGRYAVDAWLTTAKS